MKITIGDMSVIKKGQYITKKEAIVGPYPVILGGQEPAYYINKYNHTGKAIVISRSGASAGYVSKWNEPIFVTDGFLIEPKENTSFEYLYYTLKNNQHILHNLQHGAAIPHVTPALINSVEVELPEIPTQHRIAEILQRYDALIENYQKQIKLLEEAAQRLYKEWFVDLHFPGYENVTIVNGIPEGWEKKKLRDLFTFVRGRSYTSKELSDVGGVTMVNLKNIQAFGGYKRNAEKHYIGKFNEDQKLQKGDLIMGVTDMTKERRLVGHTALIPNLDGIVTYSMDLIKIIPENIPNVFLYGMFRYGGVSNQISPLANGVNVLHLKPESMMDIDVTIPSRGLINNYVSFIGKGIDEILSLESQIRSLTEARDRLLPKLMSGEIEV